jgi:hypothetical protein
MLKNLIIGWLVLGLFSTVYLQGKGDFPSDSIEMNHEP